MVERLDDVLAEQEAGPARGEPPAVDVVRVRPEEVAHGALVGHLLLAVEEPDLVDRVDQGREAAVHAEDGARAGRGAGRGARGARAGGAGPAGRRRRARRADGRRGAELRPVGTAVGLVAQPRDAVDEEALLVDDVDLGLVGELVRQRRQRVVQQQARVHLELGGGADDEGAEGEVVEGVPSE